MEDGELQMEQTRLADGQVTRSRLWQTCQDFQSQGPDSFWMDTTGDGKGNRLWTFVRDPEETGVMWLRYRWLVGRREALGMERLYLPTLQRPSQPGHRTESSLLDFRTVGSK